MEHLTRDELVRLLSEARKHRERDWVMILVAYWHGLRVSELIELRPANFAGGFLTVQRLKGSKRTSQPLIEHENELLNEKLAVDAWLEKLTTERLFPITRFQFWRLMQLYCRRAEIPPHKAHPHVLKSTCGMLHIKTAGIENVRQWLGHRSINSTGEYLKVTDEEAARAIGMAQSEAQDIASTSAQRIDSLDGVSVEETLRRVLRQLEQGKERGGKRKS